MKLDEGKLILTETELAEVKKANVMATPSIAGFYLRSFVKNKNLVEDLEKQPDVKFYTECIQAYRKKNYEVNMYKAKVKCSGNHYFAGDEVKGSKIEKREDGTTWLFDDEPIQECPFYGDGRDEWVEVDETTVVRL